MCENSWFLLSGSHAIQRSGQPQFQPFVINSLGVTYSDRQLEQEYTRFVQQQYGK